MRCADRGGANDGVWWAAYRRSCGAGDSARPSPAPTCAVDSVDGPRGVTRFTSRLRSGNIRPTYEGRDLRAAWLERRDRQGGAMAPPGFGIHVPGPVPGGCSSHRSSHATSRPGHVGPERRTQRPHLAVGDAASVSSSWSPLVVLRHGGSALCLAQTSPDTVRLTDAQCVAETRLPHHARGANGFCLFFPTQLLALALEVRRWKEDDSLRTAACSSNLPVFLDALCTHRHTPLPGRTIQPVHTRNKGKFRVDDAPGRRRCPRSGWL